MTPGQRDWIKKRVHEILTIPKPGIDSNSPKLIEGRAAIEGMVLAAMEPLLAGWGDSDEAEFHEGNLVMGAAPSWP